MKFASMTIMQTSAALFLVLASQTSQAQTHVRPTPWFNPNGLSQQPYNVIEAAACDVPAGGQLVLQTGTYHETLTLNQPMRLTASVNGPAVIGDLGTRRTTLKVFCYNTHLFGHPEIPGLPIWRDADRTGAIAGHLNGLRNQGVDFVGLQEVWDSDLYSTIAVGSQYPWVGYGGRSDGSNILSSGLAALSQHSLTNFAQIAYTDDSGFDASSTKGFIQMTMTKAGFQVGVFVTHTQSGDSGSNVSDRRLQLAQLSVAINIYRTFNPSHAILVMGDFNINAMQADYTGSMSTNLGGVGAVADSARNLACVGADNHCTSCNDNDLNRYFNNTTGTGGTRLDYILYGNSADGTVRLVPTFYDVRRPLSPVEISGVGNATQNGGFKSMTSRTLSDHDAIYAEFDLIGR
jgi:endonuclease/exonuclease/phosphatase family metal-dependent hydrolase